MNFYTDLYKLRERKVQFVKTASDMVVVDDKQLKEYDTAPPPSKKSNIFSVMFIFQLSHKIDKVANSIK